MMTVTVRADGIPYLRDLEKRLGDLRPVMPEIGETLVESTKQRFSAAEAPDGTPWTPNSVTTLQAYSSLFARNKNGTLKSAGVRALGAKKPLTGETRALATTINYQVLDAHTVAIGSPQVYAATQQFGGTKAQFPHLWGDIPARPFLGVSDADDTAIKDLVRTYLLEG